MNITEVLAQLQVLTNRNLEILKALNDSFYSKREHITAVVDNVKYNIPSFLYLESKIGDLENNFRNLVDAPKTGTAAFVFDGNTQEIQMRSFSTTPDEVRLESTSNFDIEQNQIFKDFLSPNPYIRLDLSSIGDDTVEVVVKKVDILNSNLLSQITGISSENSTVEWPSVQKILYGYETGKDYVEYDTIRRLPVRGDVAKGTYTIHKIVKNWTDEDLIEHYILETNEQLNYYVNSGTIQRQVSVGDSFVTANGASKMTVVQLDYQKNTVEVTIDNGAFADLTEYNSGYSNNEYSILRYFSLVGQDQMKYIDVPLEEDQHIMVFVAALESRLNIQGPWGVGLLIDTDSLTMEEDGIIYKFTDYYNTHINNIGDTLYGLTKMFSTDLFNMSADEYSGTVSVKPEINTDLLHVIEINSHLNDSESVKKIRSLHNQKSTYKSELDTVQADIDQITKLLSELSFSDTSSNRTVYENQLTDLNARKAELNKNISEIVEEINDNINSADVPIENAKYHIRGFYDVSDIEETTGKKVIKIDVQYRYKNRNRMTGTATSFSLDGSEDSKTYIYSDWNTMPSPVVVKQPTVVSKTITVDYPASTDEVNLPSFNQIDIPITQGESVDIRLRVQYSDGYPFIEMLSDWSPIVNVGFPEEFVANMPMTRIIETNNEDAEQYRFRNILEKEGVLVHVGDKIMDQDIEYFHQPEHIASGFYTDERRVIPLKDKLMSMDNDIHSVLDEIMSLDPTQLDVTVSDSASSIEMLPYTYATFVVPAYSSYAKDNLDEFGNAVDIININIKNNTNHNTKLFSMFTGEIHENVKPGTMSRFDPNEYCTYQKGAQSEDDFLSVYGYDDTSSDLNDDLDIKDANLFGQHQNQLVYFRLKNPYTGSSYYSSGNVFNTDDKLCGSKEAVNIVKNQRCAGASLVPVVTSISTISLTDGQRFKILKPGDSITIPVEFRYCIDQNTRKTSIQKTVSFDFWTSLFSDPVNYTLTVRANNVNDTTDKSKSSFEKNV